MTIHELLQSYQNRTVILIDNLWHLYRSTYAFSEFVGPDGQPTGHFFGLCRLIRTINDNYPGYLIIICEDGIPVRRKETDNNYKSNRESSISFYKDYDFEYRLMQDIPNVFFAYNEVEESDDIMFSISRIKDYNNKFIIFSGDNDLLQSIDETTVVSRSIQAGRIETIDQTSSYYIDKFKDIPPSHLPYYRAIVGDTSDVLPSISPRFPRDVARAYAKACIPGKELPDSHNIELFEGHEDMSKTKLERLKTISESERFGINLEMMQLRPVDITIRPKDKGYRQSMVCANELGLNSFANWVRFKSYV